MFTPYQVSDKIQTNDYQKTPNMLIQTYTSYIHIDSSKRKKESTINYDDNIFNLQPFPILFTHDSSIVTILMENHPFNVDDLISLSNVVSKNVILENIIMVKKNSHFMRFFHKNHGISLYNTNYFNNPNDFIKIDYVDELPELYNENDNIDDGINEYFILKNNLNLNLSIQISNIKGIDSSYAFIGNIPINFLNNKHIVYLLFIKNGTSYIPDPNSYLIMLNVKASINYRDGINYLKDRSNIIATNTIHIIYNNLYGIPLSFFNFEKTYATIISITKNTFSIDIKYPAIVDPKIEFYNATDLLNQNIEFDEIIYTNRGGGSNIYIRKINSIDTGYPYPNSYNYPLERIYKNVISAKIIGTIFPNSLRIIDDNNNKLYWKNLSDGNFLYHLEIKPGNYSPRQLEKAIEAEFSKTIRCQYIQDFLPKNISPDTLIYDDNGYNKYHSVKIIISEITDQVSLINYREISRFYNTDLNPIILIPDGILDITMSNDLRINFGALYDPPINIIPFDPLHDKLFIYFTPKIHSRISSKFPNSNGLLYKYQNHIINDIDNGFTFRVILERSISILLNFYRNKSVFPHIISTTEIVSINTSTILNNFAYDYLTGKVFKIDHKLKKNDIIITDKFINYNLDNNPYIYEIIDIIDSDSFIVEKIEHGKKYKFIYDGIILNFGEGENFYQWLDTISYEEEIQINDGFSNTLSLISIKPSINNNTMMIINHPNHQLFEGSKIIISDSLPINHVPLSIINKEHIIYKIIDENNYQIILEKYTPIPFTNYNINTVTIRYPESFQLFFNYQDTLGKILNFNDIGNPNAITPYRHIIKNSDGYITDPQSTQEIGKLNMTGPNYFYLCCQELGLIQNTNPVKNVFSIIYWEENPGNIVFNSFVPTVQTFNPQISSLSSLYFDFFNQDGQLINFNGIDHSFMIEIVEMYTQPSMTDYSSNMNAIIPVNPINFIR